jgi:hypothetical protein
VRVITSKKSATLVHSTDSKPSERATGTPRRTSMPCIRSARLRYSTRQA